MTTELKRFYQSDESISNLEMLLQASLNPVSPNPDYVSKLKSRLVVPSVEILENPSTQKAYLIVAAGLFVGIFIVWFIRLFSNRAR
ncbi:MAG: hypothetical protein MUO76_02245 [Anaerolineaceae bacterium]|nr:hypothetical protein [Anaerolineaceae bacterium]